MDATLLSAMGGWNMNFTKQDERARILNEMFGITVEDIPYVSYKYSNWLMDRGLIAVKYINLTKNILRKASSLQLTEEQTQAVKALDTQYDETVRLFDAASASMTEKDNNALKDARNKLREMAEQTAQLIDSEAKALIDEVTARTKALLEANWESLSKIAETLLEDEVIMGLQEGGEGTGAS